jgi:ech hydrogenase subunit A
LAVIFFLILFPLAAALILLAVKNDTARGVVVIAASVVIGAASVLLAVQHYFSGDALYHIADEFINEIVEYAMTAIEVCLAVIVFALGIKHKKYLASALAAVQTPLMLWFERSTGRLIEVKNPLVVDNLTVIMTLIVGIVGTLICVYALGYMKDFQRHNHGAPDRRPWFFFLLFLFLAAMFGLVTSNNLVWMYFFWEITTLCSFFLIGFTKTPEAVNNSFRALIMNLLGGLGFALAIMVAGNWYQTLEISQLLAMAQQGIDMTVPVVLLSFAGIAKAAQMPFNSWLLGAMVAPTPTSALLHSSTMVKAGVFLIVKLSPLMGWNLGGFMVMMVGGITFLMASFAAVSQSNAKRVLAYSTVANLGLIVACAGVGTPAAAWAAVMLIIFHAVTKSLLFLCVGTAEHNIGSRDIEDMDGLFDRMPRLAALMTAGISAMFLAPFGMLVSKWAALQAVVVSGNLPLVLFVVFGSSVTLFYWGKWLGKMTAVMAGRENIQRQVHAEEWTALCALTALVVIACLTFPIYSDKIVVPYLMTAFPNAREGVALAVSSDNMWILVVMIALIILLPLMFFGKTKKKIVPIYMAGAGLGDDLSFTGAMQEKKEVSLRNWYMEGYFGEKKMNRIGVTAACVVLAITFSMLLGGML